MVKTDLDHPYTRYLPDGRLELDPASGNLVAEELRMLLGAEAVAFDADNYPNYMHVSVKAKVAGLIIDKTYEVDTYNRPFSEPVITALGCLAIEKGRKCISDAA